MKLQMCVLVLLVGGCSPSDPFVNFSGEYAPEQNAVPLDAGPADSGSDSATDSATDADSAPRTDGEDATLLRGSGGASGASTGGASTGGAGGASTGGSSTGGASPTGGLQGAGGIIEFADACVLVLHINGIGQMWKDCELLGTYDEAQAMRACVAFTGDKKRCNRVPGCGTAPWVIQAADAAGTYDWIWGYSGNTTGYVGAHGACPNSTGQQWG
jgi:hypothetical protein